MRPNRLQNALTALGDAIREVNAAIDEMRREHDPLASHIFVSRRNYRDLNDTKSGKRRDTAARLRWQSACDLGFRGTLGEWERLLGATLKRLKSRGSIAGREGRSRSLRHKLAVHLLGFVRPAL